MIATTLAPEPAAAAVSTVTADTIARAATQFVTAGSSTGLVPASSAFILAEGVINAMLWIKWKGVVAGAGAFLALGIGAGVGAGFSSPRAAARGDDVNLVQAKPDVKTTDAQPSPAEQYRRSKRYDAAEKAYQELPRDPLRRKTKLRRFTSVPGCHRRIMLRHLLPWPSDILGPRGH